ncbi:unnamed protein product [Soboliphyme baturini]|uniref:MFS domain-containing protein n=1 Tax=Soboliphyme baturini TaxID=241478 RepID=A0A183J3L6_9BILA|nr:unnamed protein product [Soboliphyme baturini]
MVTIASQLGVMFGSVFSFATSGVLADSEFLGGWPLPFYVGGIIGFVWFLFWVSLVSSSPDSHPYITPSEKNYITGALLAEIKGDQTISKKVKFTEVPWASILLSPPVWCVFISHFSFNWCFYILLTTLPQYFKTMLGFNLRSNGLLSSIPYIAIIVVQLSVGQIADLLRERFNVKTVYVRKFCDCTGHFLPGVCLLIVGFLGCNPTGAVAMLVLMVGISGFCLGGFAPNLFDICPSYAGIVMGISNTLATVAGIAGPYVTAVLTEGPPSFQSWRKVFYITTSIYWFATVFYFFFAEATIQKWAISKPQKKVEPPEKF